MRDKNSATTTQSRATSATKASGVGVDKIFTTIVVVLGLTMIGRACDSTVSPPPAARVVTPTPDVAPPADRSEPVATGIERAANGDISIDPMTASDEAKRAFVLETLQRQEQHQRVEDQRDRERKLEKRVEELERRAACEQSYRASEKTYRETGLTLAQVCP